MKNKSVIPIVVNCIEEDKRLVQVYDSIDLGSGEKDQNHEWCIHGVKYRWSCDDCEDYFEGEVSE